MFERVEKKYLMSKDQAERLKNVMKSTMKEDNYHDSMILNLYYDTKDHRLIRSSLEKPVYKEKLRIRSYCIPTLQDEVFFELKKKYQGIVYKRRCSVVLKDAYDQKLNLNNQIEKEIAYFLDIYEKLEPAMVISYHRQSYVGHEDHSFRITFDDDLLERNYDLDLCKGIYGNPLLDEKKVLMEIKLKDAIPLWLANELDQMNVFPISFSKYGLGYAKENCHVK